MGNNEEKALTEPLLIIAVIPGKITLSCRKLVIDFIAIIKNMYKKSNIPNDRLNGNVN